jgi:5'-deoxynucleotidase YfbR-like HD superfamily hydrolase
MNQAERLVAARTGGAVERCHGIRHQMSYSNARHSWGVAMIILQVWPEHFQDLAAFAISHDVPEGWVGDIPMPVKKYSQEIKSAVSLMESKIFALLQLPDEDDIPPDLRVIFKAADQFELWLWAMEERSFGNKHAECVVRELETYWEQEQPLPSKLHDLWRDLRATGVVHSTDALIREMHQ